MPATNASGRPAVLATMDRFIKPMVYAEEFAKIGFNIDVKRIESAVEADKLRA